VVGVVPELGWVGFEVVSQLRAGEIINVYMCVSVFTFAGEALQAT